MAKGKQLLSINLRASRDRFEMAGAKVEVILPTIEEERGQISWRVSLLALALIPISAYWMARRGQDGIMSLGVPPVVFVFLLALLNFPFARWLKRFALTQADLMLHGH
ncbi:MAG: hypothetical protein SQA66_12300 [Candidatus Fervidibacter sacchari]